MHLRELDIGRMCKAFVFTLFCLLLMVAPLRVQAQDAPTPVPTLSPGAQTIIQQTTNAVDRYGVITVSLFIVLVVVLGVFLRIVVPLLNANTAANQQIAMMNQNSSKLQFDTVNVLQNISGTLTTIVNTLESKDDAHKDRLTMLEKSNDHADAQRDTTAKKLEAIDGKIDGVIQTLEEARKEAMTKEDFDKSINPLVLKLDRAIEEMRAMKAPTPVIVIAPAAEAAPDEPETPSSSTILGVPLS